MEAAMPTWLVVMLGLAFVVALLLTTPAGRRLRQRLPIAALRSGRAPQEDRDYLLRICDGDPARVATLLERERERQPELSEADTYRRAIRRHLRPQS
jgi:hypothetical protein